MAESESRDTVTRAYSILEDDDPTEFLSMCAIDIEWVYPEVEGLEYSGRWDGRDGVERFLEAHDAAEEILDLSVHDLIAQGDRVVVVGHFRGESKPAGREWETDFVHDLTVRHGKIVRFQAYFDTAAGVAARREA